MPLLGPLTETIGVLLRHCSIRKYKPNPIPDEWLDAIVSAAQAASSSSHMQAYTIIAVTNDVTRSKLGELCGEANRTFMVQCPLFLVWCADLNRLDAVVEEAAGLQVPADIEHLLIASVDTALAAQNAALAAESLGLGIVYVGGIRNHPAGVSKLLGLPRLTFPLFGMSIGFPDENPLQRPRLPRSVVFHEGRYDAGAWKEDIVEYDSEHSRYTNERSGGHSSISWTGRMADRIANSRSGFATFLKDQGFRL
ncbi:FMN reductase (NADPH) [compost metagenome]